MKKIKIVTRGAYGKIYECADKEGKFAIVKRNLVDQQANGACSMREIDLLLQLRGHPFVVDIQSVAVGNPFVEVLSPVARAGEKDDLVHMVLEKADHSLRQRIHEDKMTTEHIRLAACHILLALEYVHAQNIIHRDIKSENILVFTQSHDADPVFKLCDFGLSKIMTKALPPTPKIVTYTHRAPEIICEYPYSFKCDLWSVGCVLYEMICGALPFKVSSDNDIHLLQTILNNLHYEVNEKELRELLPSNTESKVFIPGAARVPRLQDVKNTNSQHKSLKEQLPQADSELIDLLQHLLVFHPDKRYTATEALEHKYFAPCRQLIEKTRKEYPLQVTDIGKYNITLYKCLERKWACNLAMSVYSIRENLDWYYDRSLFQAIDLFDRYLAIKMMEESKLHTEENASDDIDKARGRVHSHKEVCSIFTCCLYMATKYFTTIHVQYSFADIVNCTGIMTVDEDSIYKLEQFELMLLWKCLNYRLYRETCLEVAGREKELSSNEINDLLVFYTSITNKDKLENSNGQTIYKAFLTRVQ